MKMGFRWYGEGNDTVSLDDIRQIPGVETVVWSLHQRPAGRAWETAEIEAEIARITSISPAAAARGVTKTLDAEVVESVNVHESIKLGRTVLGLGRDEAIDMIARRFIDSRRRGWQERDEHGRLLRRTMAIASLGGATLDNEENYLIKKLFTGAGAIQIENQARI